jgi:hypothetical protein
LLPRCEVHALPVHRSVQILAFWQRLVVVDFQELCESFPEAERWFSGTEKVHGCLSGDEDIEDASDVLVLTRLEVDDVGVFADDWDEWLELLAG